ncbi:MAG: UDP-N-acetylmuramoyl-L-alanine--D-glutamate ligase [Cardiobacteriaceae bacterium]|nr:UDP-N-acetylmuramoyl-L-alanine--D-glutamate ligase [Cardiobacteriaceae bacterium]
MNSLLIKLRALNLAEPILVVGMGASGKVTLDLLREAGYEAFGVDEKFSERRVYQRNLDDQSALHDAGTLIVSPGIDRRRVAFQHTYAPQLNDIELFARLCDKPVLAVTGSNGKSTVVTLLAEILNDLGKVTRLCGNIGYPALSALFDEGYEQVEYYVLELSSYQLELCPSLYPKVGAVLNVTPDHLDRYDDFQAYAAAKEHLVRQSQVAVLNADDQACAAMVESALNLMLFGQSSSLPNRVDEGQLWVNDVAVFDCRDLGITGKHNESNALCALLMLSVLGIQPNQAHPALIRFKGLPHRVQTVAEHQGVRFIDDSKATNIGATQAALAGFNEPLILILGGVGKGQDFNELAETLTQHPVKHILLIGKDNRDMESALQAHQLAYEVCGVMEMAVKRAKALATAGDIVLLSPATASFDQYSGYHERGNHFAYEAQQCSC